MTNQTPKFEKNQKVTFYVSDSGVSCDCEAIITSVDWELKDGFQTYGLKVTLPSGKVANKWAYEDQLTAI